MAEYNQKTDRNNEKRIRSGGLSRRFYLHLPPSKDSTYPLPLMIALHGRLDNAKKMIRQTRFNPIADREGFVVVYPDGVRRSWADGRGITHADSLGIDDVAFIGQLIDELTDTYAIDQTRIFLVGHSNGGFMALRLANEQTHRFAATAIVSASLSSFLAKRFKPAGPIPILFVHGTEDEIIPYGGGFTPSGSPTMPVEEAARIWAEFNGCDETSSREQVRGRIGDRGVFVRTYDSELKNSPVALYRIQGGDHVWPDDCVNSEKSDKGSRGNAICLSEEIWAFFASAANQTSLKQSKR